MDEEQHATAEFEAAEDIQQQPQPCSEPSCPDDDCTEHTEAEERQQEEASSIPASQQPSNPAANYQHRTGNRAYLESAVMPQLQEALLALLKRVEQDKLELAKGSAWEEGPYRPPEWRPFSALRWLAEYLLEHKAQISPLSSELQPEHEAAAGGLERSPADGVQLAA